jgi:hypothetical protein
MKSVHNQVWHQSNNKNFDLILEKCNADVVESVLENVFDPISFYDLDVLWLAGVSFYDALDKQINP